MFITLSLIGWTLQAAAQGTVCERTDEVRDAILTASGVSACADLTVRDLREITSLDLHAAELGALSAGDFDGLVRLDSLDLSDNLLTSLPAGVFDQLFLLEELTLEDNLFAALPDNLFDAWRGPLEVENGAAHPAPHPTPPAGPGGSLPQEAAEALASLGRSLTNLEQALGRSAGEPPPAAPETLAAPLNELLHLVRDRRNR